jgi:hypothetical protein
MLAAVCAPCLVIPTGVRGSKERVSRERAEKFAANHSIAKLLVTGFSESDFKKQMPAAQLQDADSVVAFGHRRYRNENSAYDFLDERLMSVEWREVCEESAYQGLVAEISAALG